MSVIDGSKIIHLGSRHRRIVLGVLLCRPNMIVAPHLLIEAVWGASPPQSAGPNLRNLISNLRRLHEGVDLTRTFDGYVLHVPPGNLDAIEFQRLVAKARMVTTPDTAYELYSEALSLWHGPAFGLLADTPVIYPEAQRLNELRLIAEEERVQAGLTTGRHHKVIAELSRLTAANPHRERLHRQHMVALYRSGRKPEALAVYHSIQRTTANDFGIDPSNQMKALHQAILTDEPALTDPLHQV